MPPQKSFVIKQNTPEAEKLEQRVHEELKEIWDPAADATVAKYVTAMLAKGYDRKKLLQALRGILQDTVSERLIAWLYPHLRKHANDYQSKETKASPKLAPKPAPSATKAVPTEEEVELRLEDLEAQQLEGSDLEDDVEAHGEAAAPTCMPREAAAPSNRCDADVQSQQRDRGVASQDARAGGVQRPPAGGQNGSRAEAGEKTERRHREPIPIPIFSEPPRSRLVGGTGRSGPPPSAADRAAAAGASAETAAASVQPRQPLEEKRTQEDQQAKDQVSPAAVRERRRLKSTVVLDWDAWHKQKQPTDEPPAAKPAALPEKPAAPERAPSLPRAAQDAADQPSNVPTSQREREDGRDRERERERDRGRDREREQERGAGPSRRRQSNEADGDRPGSRHRDGEGDALTRRGHGREGDAGSRWKGGDTAHRSRSRSRSRSPRGRRSGRAPLVTANLLRSALREVDTLAAGSGARGSKASVFERLGTGAPAADVAPARASALQRVAGSDKADRAMDTSGSGRKRGPEGDADVDAATLGSPPKSARGLGRAVPKSNAPLRKGAGQAAREPPPGPTLQAGEGAAKRRIEFAPPASSAAAARQPSEVRKQAAAPAPSPAAGEPIAGNGGPADQQPAAAAATSAAVAGAVGPVDPKAAELEALRKQMAEMAEKLARMEAAKDKEQQPQPKAQSQPQAQLQPRPLLLPQDQLQPHQLSLQPTPQPHLKLQLQPLQQVQTQHGQPLQPHIRPQTLPLQQAQSQQSLYPPQRTSIAARLQPRAVPPSTAVMPVRPSTSVPIGVGSVSMDGDGRCAGQSGGSMATIMPTSMSGVVIEGGSGSPPRRNVTQPPEPPPPKVDQQRLAAAQLDADLRSVVVENVHFLASEEVLAAHFSVVGPVKKVTIVHDKLTGRPTGIAVVEMATEQATQAAVALSGSPLMDLPIVVTLKAALMLQDFNFAGLGLDAVAPVMVPPPVGAGPAGVPPRSRLNPAAAPFVPGLTPAGIGLGRGVGGPMGSLVRPPIGAAGAGGRQPWPGAGGRGRGSNVWVRDPAKAANAVGSSLPERS